MARGAITEVDYRIMEFQNSNFANKNLELAKELRILAHLSHGYHMIDLRLMMQPGYLTPLLNRIAFLKFWWLNGITKEKQILK
jgi:hypothetical protein